MRLEAIVLAVALLGLPACTSRPEGETPTPQPTPASPGVTARPSPAFSGVPQAEEASPAPGEGPEAVGKRLSGDLARLEEEAAASPDDPKAVLALARVQMASGRASEASRTLQGFLERHEDSAAGWSLLADVAQASGDLETADGAARKFRSLQPAQRKAHQDVIRIAMARAATATDPAVRTKALEEGLQANSEMISKLELSPEEVAEVRLAMAELARRLFEATGKAEYRQQALALFGQATPALKRPMPQELRESMKALEENPGR